MMFKTAAPFLAVLLVVSSPATGESPDRLSLDDALARQSAADLISGVESAYDCSIVQRSFRFLGNEEQSIYLIQVEMNGTECDEALTLLARHGSTRDFIFRQWQPRPDVEQVDPREVPDSLIDEIIE